MRIQALLAAAAVFAAPVAFGDTVDLSTLDSGPLMQYPAPAVVDHSAEKMPLSIGGQSFAHGLGVHSPSRILIHLKGDATTFSATIGADDAAKAQAAASGNGAVSFTVVGDDRVLWPPRPARRGRPGPGSLTHPGDAPQKITVDVSGVQVLILEVSPGNDGVQNDSADWADPTVAYNGAKPEFIPPQPDAPVVLTPPAPATPRINGARVFGVRPGHPFLFTVAATGDRPMTFSADNLPAGLALDPENGIITGTTSERGDHPVTLHAKNARGETQSTLDIIVGDRIALTPQMGWNSWNCFASAVDEGKVKSAADAMVNSGLINHGWTYINTDDYWENNQRRGRTDPTLAGPARSPDGNILPNKRFPDMKSLTDYIHARGLKCGLYSSPGPTTCGGCTGSYQHEQQDATQWAAWGFDYIKYDWCSYGGIAGRNPDLAAMQKPYRVMRDALNHCDRDILFSLCQYGMGNVWEWGDQIGGNSWRTTGDIRDNWQSMSSIGFGQNGHEKYAGPGHWNDPDMLVVGYVGWGPRLHPSGLTPNEQYTHISLWCLLDAPLLIGCDMTKLDSFTRGLLTNDEVLAVNQDALGKQAARVLKTGPGGMIEVWAKDMADGSKAVGIFNRSELQQPYTLKLSDLGLNGEQTVRDLWRQKDVATTDASFTAPIPRHGVVLLRITPSKR